MVLLEFSMSPLDKGESLSQYVARSLDIIDRSGVPYQLTPMGTILEGEWDDVMAVNLRAPFALTQALLPLLQKSDNASVVFTSSGVGREARALWGAYSVSKVAIEAVSKIFAAEHTYPNILLLQY